MSHTTAEPGSGRATQSSLVYLTWDGPGAQYLRSLYLPIFAKMPLPTTVVQVSYGDPDEIDATATLARTLGVGYRGCRFERGKQTSATLAAGGGLLLEQAALLAWGGNSYIMARSLVPAAALLAVGLPRSRFLFDADGLVADERVDFAGWSARGLPYRGARLIEQRALRRACVTLTRTEASRRVLLARARGQSGPILVAPNGSDEQRFVPMTAEERDGARGRMGLRPEDLLVVYCGTLGPQYRPDLMAVFVEALRRHSPNTRVRFEIFTSNLDTGLELAERVGDAGAKTVAPDRVAEELGPADLALALREPSFSQCAVAPIKVGEYLLCGIPVVANRGVGDLDRVLDSTYAFVLDELTAAAVENAAKRLASTRLDRASARRAGEMHFALDVAVAGYTRAIEFARGRQDTEEL